MASKRLKAPGKSEIGDHIFWARTVLTGLSQENFADLAKEELSRLQIRKAEAGDAKGNSAKLRKGLAHALGVSRVRIDDYLDGVLGKPGEDTARRLISSAETELTPRYNNREEAIHFLVRDGHGLIHEVKEAADRAAVALDSEHDPSALEWANMIRPLIKLPHKGRAALGVRAIEDGEE